MDPSALIAGIVFVILGLLIVTAIGAIILRAAVSLFNKMVGAGKSSPAVNEPSMPKAIGIMLLSSFVNAAAGAGIGFVLGASGMAEEFEARAILMAQLASIPISALIMSVILSATLPTTFLRGLIITVLVVLIYLAIVLGIGLVVFAVSFLLIPR